MNQLLYCQLSLNPKTKGSETEKVVDLSLSNPFYYGARSKCIFLPE